MSDQSESMVSRQAINKFGTHTDLASDKLGTNKNLALFDKDYVTPIHSGMFSQRQYYYVRGSGTLTT